MLSADFFSRRVTAFQEAAIAASQKNDASGCEVDEGYIEVSRVLKFETRGAKEKAADLAKALLSLAGENELEWDESSSEFKEGDTAEGGETSVGISSGRGYIEVRMFFGKYFGAECRDNTPEHFAGWAQGYSEFFDSVEAAAAKALIGLEQAYVGRVAWVSEVDEMGVVELEGDTWYGIDSLRFAFSTLSGERIAKGDRVKLSISGGRKAPVVQSMTKV